MEFKKGDIIKINPDKVSFVTRNEHYYVSDIIDLYITGREGTSPHLVINDDFRDPEYYVLVTSILREEDGV